ncbi:MAG TPA: hypothetical protein VGD14_10595, partial [bacterium]
MRSFRFLLIFSISFLFVLNAKVLSQNWSDEIPIVNGKSPDLDIDPKTGNLHIVCIQNGTGAIYTEMTSSGTIIRQEVIPGTEKE